MSCGVGRRCGSDPVLLWLWCRPATTAPIRPLAWQLPYATGMALEKTKRQEKKKKELNLMLQGPREQRDLVTNSPSKFEALLEFPGGSRVVTAMAHI